MDRARNCDGDLLLARWESHRYAARRDAVLSGRLIAGAGMDVVGTDRGATEALVVTLEPRTMPLLNGDILPTSA